MMGERGTTRERDEAPEKKGRTETVDPGLYPVRLRSISGLVMFFLRAIRKEILS